MVPKSPVQTKVWFRLFSSSILFLMGFLALGLAFKLNLEAKSGADGLLVAALFSSVLGLVAAVCPDLRVQTIIQLVQALNPFSALNRGHTVPPKRPSSKRTKGSARSTSMKNKKAVVAGTIEPGLQGKAA